MSLSNLVLEGFMGHFQAKRAGNVTMGGSKRCILAEILVHRDVPTTLFQIEAQVTKCAWMRVRFAADLLH